MPQQNIPDMKCPCPGTLQAQPSLIASGESIVNADDAWARLMVDMPSGMNLMNFLQAVERALPRDCGGDCGTPKISSTSGPVGFSGSATRDPGTQRITWRYTWTFTLNYNIACDQPKKTLTVGRPELTVVDVPPPEGRR